MHNREAVLVLEKNKGRYADVGNGILLDCLLPIKLHQSYRPLPHCIQELNPVSQEIWSGPAGQLQESIPLIQFFFNVFVYQKKDEVLPLYRPQAFSGTFSDHLCVKLTPPPGSPPKGCLLAYSLSHTHSRTRTYTYDTMIQTMASGASHAIAGN